MNDIRMVHCLFEQSGTFKKEFEKLGIHAEDYDLKNDFGQTDHEIDLFAEIEKGYEGKPSIFDNMSKDDIILAFFPCIEFETQKSLWFQGQSHSQEKWDDKKKLEWVMNEHETLHKFYILISKLAYIAIDRGLRLVIENPCQKPHYLTTYWPIRAKVIDMNRRDHGDYYKKPTQYWFIGFEPSNNLVMDEGMELTPLQTIGGNMKIDDTVSKTVNRSLIHPQYARWLIRTYIL